MGYSRGRTICGPDPRLSRAFCPGSRRRLALRRPVGRSRGGLADGVAPPADLRDPAGGALFSHGHMPFPRGHRSPSSLPIAHDVLTQGNMHATCRGHGPAMPGQSPGDPHASRARHDERRTLCPTEHPSSASRPSQASPCVHPSHLALPPPGAQPQRLQWAPRPRPPRHRRCAVTERCAPGCRAGTAWQQCVRMARSQWRAGPACVCAQPAPRRHST